MAGERGDVVGEPLRRRAGAAARRARARAPSASWPRNVDAPVRAASPRVRGLAASCSSAAKRIAAAAGELVGERLGQQRAHRLGVLAELRRRRSPRGARRRRAPRACGRGRRGGGRRSARRRAARPARAARRRSSPSASISSSPARAAGRRPTIRLSSGEHALGARRRSSSGARSRDRRGGRRLDRELELDGDAGRRAACAAGRRRAPRR